MTESALAIPMPELIADKLSIVIKTTDNKPVEEITFLTIANVFP